MSALEGAYGLDFYLVQKHLRSLRVLVGSARAAYMVAIEDDDGRAVRQLVERALLETAAFEEKTDGQTGE
jgi:hypothetical protein